MAELFEGRQGADPYDRHRTYTRVYEVYTDDDDDGPATAGGTALLPRLGASHPEDVQAVVVRVNPVQDPADPRRWLVNIEYDTQPPMPDALQPESPTGDPGAEQSPADRPDNPLNRPAVWHGSFQQIQEVLRDAYLTDANGVNIGGSKPVVNSAGFLFDPPVMVERSRPVLTITKNIPSLNIFQLNDLVDSVNTVAWKGLEVRTARCVGVEFGSGFENGVFFWQVTWTLALKFDKWDLRVLDAGFAERVVTGTDPGPPPAPIIELRPILDPQGNPITEPVPLDGNGRKLGVNQPEVYLLFSGYKQRDFNTLIPV